jgi:hypothetical protein
VAALVVVGFVVARNGHAQPVAASQPSASASASGSPHAVMVPGVSRAAVTRKLGALGVPIPSSGGLATGQVTDSTAGADLLVTVYSPGGGDTIAGINCVFILNDGKVDARLVGRATQCVLVAVPATDQAAVSSWLAANGPAVTVDTSRSYDLDGLRVTVGHAATAFSATLAALQPAG